MNHNVVIQDDFFLNPYKIREHAISKLKQSSSSIINDKNKNYPGVRIPVDSEIMDKIKNFIEYRSERKIDYLVGNFHITSSIHKVGIIHKDPNPLAGIIYLNENPPSNSGTFFYSSIPKKYPVNDISEFCDITSTTEDTNIIRDFAQTKEEYNAQFDIEFQIENKFNRFAAYDGTKLHSPGEYFGTDFEDSRLALVFVFKLL
jgi:hypothetical protein